MQYSFKCTFKCNKYIRIRGKESERSGKGSTLFISSEDIDDIIKTVKPLENSGVLNDGFTEAVKQI